ncbi:MAG: GntR family transcriptional regulator [Oscillospiraceae bacterium]
MININYRDGRPVYAQIKDELRLLIVTGAVGPNDKMPSVRELAQELAINPNTIQRAYRELETEGYIYSIPGKGSFAGEKREVGADRMRELLRRFDEAVRELSFLGIGGKELCTRIREGIKQ